MRTSSLLAAALFATFAAVAAADFPESFEAEAHPLVSPSQCLVERVQEHATDGAWALKVTFKGNEQDTWPGLIVDVADQALDRRSIVSFDVYNPQAEAVGLSYRIDGADGNNTFGGATLAPEANTTVEVWMSSHVGDGETAGITRIFPYIRMPRQDYVLYFDHFRIESMEGRFARMAYAEIADEIAAPSATATLFLRNELSHVFPNSLPWPGEIAEALALFAAPGETEPLAISFRTHAAIGEASVTVPDLQCESAASLPAAAVELGRVRYLDKKVTYSSKEYVADMPTYIEPGNTFQDLPADTTRTFWLRFRVPPDAAPGQYRGVVRFQFDDAAQELPLTLTVLPFALPEIENHFIGEYYRPHGYATDDEWKAGVTADLSDMRDHGMTSVGACFGFDTDRVTFDNGSVNLGLDGTSRFEHFLNEYVRLGFTMPIVLLADSGQGAAAKVAGYGTPEYDAAYIAFWTAAQAACKERGWPELIVQPVDEPGWQDQEHRDRNVHLLKLLKQIPGMRTEQDGPADAYFRDEAGPYADMWNYNGGVDDFEQLREIRKNHLVAFYNNDVESYQPEVDRYVAGFFMKAAGIDGVYNWEYRGGYGSLYDDLDGPSGDWVHNYPVADVSAGGPSIAWEMAREGVDDLRYLTLFDDCLAKAREAAPDSQAVKQADVLRAYVFESLQASPRVRGRAQWTARWPREEAETFAEGLDTEAQLFIGGELKQPNGWTHRDYQRARWALARATTDLIAACGDEPPMPSAAPGGTARLELVGATVYPALKMAAQKNAAPTTALAIPELPSAPALDGDLGDDAWQNALKIDRFVSTAGGDVPVQTSAVVGWHGDQLYVGVQCDEPQVQNRLMTCMEDGEPCFQDDCVELFFDPDGRRTGYAQLVISSRPVQWSADVRGTPWKQRVPVQAGVG